jgi:hypothetical protein
MYNIVIPRKPTELALSKLYLIDLLSVDEIADIFEYKSAKSIRRWLRKFKIPERTRKKNNMIKYGVEYPQQAQEVKEKRKQTNKKRYGVENPMHVKEFKEKHKQTCLENLGVENPSQAEEIKQKKKQTNKERYGVENPSQFDEFQEKKEKTFLEKYGGHPLQNEEVQEKKNQTCLEKYGTENVSQVEEVKEKRKQTNKERYGVEHHSSRTVKNYDIYSDFNKFCNWIKETSINLGRGVISDDVRKFFNVSITMARLKLHEMDDIVSLQDYYNFGISRLETIVEDWIKQNTTISYEKNTRKIIRNPETGWGLELDIFLPDLKIAIEINDNGSHKVDERLDMSIDKYHQLKSDLCKAKGIHLIHLWEDDIVNIDSILKPILESV